MGLDERLLVGRDVLLQRDRLVLRRAAVVADGGLDLLDGHVQAAGDQRKVGLRDP